MSSGNDSNRENNLQRFGTVTPIPLSSVIIPEHWRRIMDANLDILAESLKVNGQITPIVVRKENGRYLLVCGAHRVIAAKRIGWSHINAIVVKDMTALEAELVGLQENLRRSISFSCVLEHAIALAREKELYEQLHPESGWGGDRTYRDSSGNNSDLPSPSFADSSSKESEYSPSWVRKMVKIGGVLGPHRDVLYDTPIANKFVDLLVLAQMSEQDRALALENLRSGRAISLKDLEKLTQPIKSSDKLDEEPLTVPGVAVLASPPAQNDGLPSNHIEKSEQSVTAKGRPPATTGETKPTDSDKALLDKLVDEVIRDPQLFSLYYPAKQVAASNIEDCWRQLGVYLAVGKTEGLKPHEVGRMQTLIIGGLRTYYTAYAKELKKQLAVSCFAGSVLASLLTSSTQGQEPLNVPMMCPNCKKVRQVPFGEHAVHSLIYEKLELKCDFCGTESEATPLDILRSISNFLSEKTIDELVEKLSFFKQFKLTSD